MFAYIDPTILDFLLENHKLISIDAQGERCDPKGKVAPFISLVGPVPLPIQLARGTQNFQWYAFVRHADLSRLEDLVKQVRQHGAKELYNLLGSHLAVNSVLMLGDLSQPSFGLPPLVRVHSNCQTGDVFGSLRCDCGPQLHAALERIQQERVGAVIYMAGHEGRGIGLWAKAITYLLQDAGHDTYEANEKLGLPIDSRDFSDAGRVLRFLCGSACHIRLLGNNTLKREALEAMGITVTSQESLVVGVNRFNRRYLNSKREHGHLIPAASVEPSPVHDPPQGSKVGMNT